MAHGALSETHMPLSRIKLEGPLSQFRYRNVTLLFRGKESKKVCVWHGFFFSFSRWRWHRRVVRNLEIIGTTYGNSALILIVAGLLADVAGEITGARQNRTIS